MKKTIILLTSLLIFIPLIASASFDKNLYYGIQQDSQVKELQEFLISKGYLAGSATGNFFSLTLKAVKNFQTDNNLPSTGYFGPQSRTTANGILSTDLTASNTASASDNNPAPTSPATTNDVVSSLQAQIAILQKELDALNTQQTSVQQLQQTVQQQAQTIQQIQQNTQQIVQNTTPQVAAVPPPPPPPPAPIIYPDLQVSCNGQWEPFIITNQDGSQIITPNGKIMWTATPTGGNGSYEYNWSNAPQYNNCVKNSDSYTFTNPAGGQWTISCFSNVSSFTTVADGSSMRVYVASNGRAQFANCTPPSN